MCNIKCISIADLKSGDVLICHPKEKKCDFVTKLIQKTTKSSYTHAAIYLGDNKVAESTPGLIVNGKVRIVSVQDLCNRYSHVASFRQPDAWDDDSVKALKLFVETIIKQKSKYNFEGVFYYEKHKIEHQENIYEKLNQYFSGNAIPDDSNKSKYFCSELVADCFVATGYIAPSAAIVYKSKTYSPGCLGKDPTFGTFLGYVLDAPISRKDEFYYNSTFCEIFGC